jgi:hypothetical protein
MPKKSSSWREGSRVRTSVTLAVVPGLKASIADYGLSLPKQFATYDHDSFSWRTPPGSTEGVSTERSQTWPQAGTMRNGIVCRLRPLAPPTYERESGFWPTPVASDVGHRRRPYSQGGQSLSHVVGGPTNPMWLEWLMGFPVEHTAVGGSETQLFLIPPPGSESD